MKTLERLKSDPRVESVWDESGTDDGYWVNLRPGFADLAHDPMYPTHTIHEWTIKRVKDRMRDVRECNCKECSAVKSPLRQRKIGISMANETDAWAKEKPDKV